MTCMHFTVIFSVDYPPRWINNLKMRNGEICPVRAPVYRTGRKRDTSYNITTAYYTHILYFIFFQLMWMTDSHRRFSRMHELWLPCQSRGQKENARKKLKNEWNGWIFAFVFFPVFVSLSLQWLTYLSSRMLHFCFQAQKQKDERGWARHNKERDKMGRERKHGRRAEGTNGSWKINDKKITTFFHLTHMPCVFSWSFFFSKSMTGARAYVFSHTKIACITLILWGEKKRRSVGKRAQKRERPHFII